MFNINENNNVIKFEISSEMRMVDHIAHECREFFKKYNVTSFSNPKLVLRELLINAIEHGNRNIAEYKVTCSVEHIGDYRFKITVEDQGDGFAYNTLDMELPEEPDQIRNRGYSLINAFTEKIEFNEKGNVITVYMNLTPETEYEVSDSGEWKVIKPTGDITASTADKFRVFLLGLINDNHKMYRFDFEHVDDIDSVSLSVLICFAKMVDKDDIKGKFEVINANKDVINLFRMTRIDKVFEIDD
ncbi:MAG: ATP-binding protein [Candidatus Anammoxibacter sp.]